MRPLLPRQPLTGTNWIPSQGCCEFSWVARPATVSRIAGGPGGERRLSNPEHPTFRAIKKFKGQDVLRANHCDDRGGRVLGQLTTEAAVGEIDRQQFARSTAGGQADLCRFVQTDHYGKSQVASSKRSRTYRKLGDAFLVARTRRISTIFRNCLDSITWSSVRHDLRSPNAIRILRPTRLPCGVQQANILGHNRRSL